MADYSISVSDSTTTSEFRDVLANATRTIRVSDSTATSEHVDILRASSRDITVSDSSQTSENTDILRAGSRDVNVSERTATSENVAYTTVTNPARIVRTLNLTLTIPTAIAFSVVKKVDI